MSEDIYSEYSNYVTSILASNNLSNFKSNPSYTYMLEHVSKEKGQEYYDLIKGDFKISDLTIIEFCNKNDTIGGTILEEYSFGSCSPSSLRYIYQALLILLYAKSLKKKTLKIIEIGGGYGGLSLALHFFSSSYEIEIESYSMIDLTSPLALQKLYLSNLMPITKFTFHDAQTFGNDIVGDDYFLVSCYSLGEISIENQDKYFNILLPKVSNGFLIWNTFPYADFGRETIYQQERPLTGQVNQFIYF